MMAATTLACAMVAVVVPIASMKAYSSKDGGSWLLVRVTSLYYRRFRSCSLEVNPYDDLVNEARAIILQLDMGILKAMSTSFD